MTDVCDAFERVWPHHPSLQAHYRIADQIARIRVAGATLARHFTAPFAHLRAPDQDRCDLSIDLWDVGETGHCPPTPESTRLIDDRWALDDGTLATSDAGNLIMHATHSGVFWLDRRGRRIVGWVTSADALPLYERARPLQILLALCASDHGVHAVHGAFVARNHRGVLIAGDSGTGKSTTALCCAAAGFTYLADDWVGVGRTADNTIIGYSLYSSVSLEPAQLARVTQLRAQTVEPVPGRDLKALLLLADLFPARMGHRAAVCALALPRLAGRAESTVRPATKKDALLTMTRSAICTMRPRAGRAAFDTFTMLAHRLPAFWLDVGHDLRQIAPRIDDILAAIAP